MLNTFIYWQYSSVLIANLTNKRPLFLFLLSFGPEFLILSVVAGMRDGGHFCTLNAFSPRGLAIHSLSCASDSENAVCPLNTHRRYPLHVNPVLMIQWRLSQGRNVVSGESQKRDGSGEGRQSTVFIKPRATK